MAEVQARTVLWYLVFVGFAVNYMIRINLNITIVEMVMSKATKLQLTTEQNQSLRAVDISTANNGDLWTVTNNSLSSASVIQLDNANSISLSMKLKTNIEPCRNISTEMDLNHSISEQTTEEKEKFSLEKLLLHFLNVPYSNAGFEWNEYQQGLVLGSFFWAHWLTQIPGGILAKKFGTKVVFGLSNAAGCWMCFFIPIISYWNYKALIWWRILQGLICGLSWPAMHVLTAQWIPPNERSKFVTAYLGSSVGIAIFYPLFGFIISWTSWEWVYHICGLVGTIWWLGWLIFVYDTPALHPRIKESEVIYIQKSLGASVQTSTQDATPWRKIITSRSVWMNIIAQWGGIWGLFTLMTQAPTYFKVVHHWDIRTTGILAGLPHLMRMIFAYVFSILSDYLLRSEKMSTTNVRKLATTFCCIVKGFVVLALAFYGQNSIAAIVLLTVATMFHGAVSSGPLASIVDISPNYAGIVLGVSGMISVLPGFISPVIVGILTLENQSFESWKYVYLIAAGMLIVSGILYVLLGSSTLEPWNSPKNSYNDKELQFLSPKIDAIHKDQNNQELLEPHCQE